MSMSKRFKSSKPEPPPPTAPPSPAAVAVDADAPAQKQSAYRRPWYQRLLGLEVKDFVFCCVCV
jgi:hypothetical protein